MNEQKLTELINSKRAERHEAIEGGKSYAEMEPLADEIKKLMKQRNGLLSKGAKDCPAKECEAGSVIGMLVRDSFEDRGVTMPKIYEVGCLSCPLRARGTTPEEAVEKWNKKDYYVG